jgi:hypothetical protein
VKLPAPAGKVILSALSERDETAAVCRDKDGNPEPDPELRDTESVPLAEPVEAFFEREVRPTSPTPGSTHPSATPRTTRSASSATRSTSTATSTATRRRARSR